MPRTIRKRQMRNKKSRKQRGGELTEQQKDIKKIQETINKNIEELIKLLDKPETPKNYNIQSKGEYKEDQEYTTQTLNPMVIGNDGVNMDIPNQTPPPIPNNTTSTSTTNVGEKTSNAYD